jgi:carboxypeptidase family protein
MPRAGDEGTIGRRELVGALAGSLVLLAAAACGSVRRAEPSPPPSGDAPTATVRGRVSWPDCQPPAPTCRPVDAIPVHFADAAANRTFTAVSDGSGRYSIQVPPGSYVVIAGNADRSPYQREVVLRAQDDLTLDLTIALPTG